jgi:dUTP pyrophosphatase
MQVQLIDDRIKQFTKDVGNAGFDLQAVAYFDDDMNRYPIAEEGWIDIKSGETVLFGTGVKIWIRHPDIFGGIFARSKLGNTLGITPGNCVGVSDSSYQGEIIVGLYNRTGESYKVSALDAIAQLVFLPVITPNFEYVMEFTGGSVRGERGILCKEERR